MNEKSWPELFKETLKPAMETLMRTYGGSLNPYYVNLQSLVKALEAGDGPKTVGPDQEVWVRKRIENAIRMAIAAFEQTRVRADEPLMASAIWGLANGAAVEVIRTLGLQPCYVNLQRVTDSAPVNSQEPQQVKSNKYVATMVACSRCGRFRPSTLLERQSGRLVCGDVYSCKPLRRGQGGGYGA